MQSHGGSGSQARAVADGLDADVVTLGLFPDTDAVRKAGKIDPGWEGRLPNRSLPYTSTIVFVVRRGNPKQVRDWPDLARDGVEVITPNPKTSGNGKWSFLALWGSVTTRGGSEAQAAEFVERVYRRVPVLDAAARGATMTFAQKKLGDVHLTWENEAVLEVEEARGALEIVYPPVSVLAEPPVAVVDAVVRRKGTTAVATAYLQYLYTEEAQEVIARHHYRPTNPVVKCPDGGPVPPGGPVPGDGRGPGLGRGAGPVLRRRGGVRHGFTPTGGRGERDLPPGAARVSPGPRGDRQLPGPAGACCRWRPGRRRPAG